MTSVTFAECELRPPPHIEQRIRAKGPVLDHGLVQDIYKPLLEAQPREHVDVTHDVVYGSDDRHRLDLYRPTDTGGILAPVLMFFHGGGFVRGDKSERSNMGCYFARHGFVVVVPNYRLAPAHRWPSGGEDVSRAFEWTRERIEQYGGDSSRIFLVGESAGAAHVATALLLRRLHPSGGLSVSGCVLISGVYNPHLERLACRQFGIATPDPRNEAYFGSDFAQYPAMSIVELIDAPPVPLLITFAELDLFQMQVQAGELFARLTTRHGFECDLHVVRGHNHLTQVFAVNTGDESLSSAMLRFLRRLSRST